MEKSTDLDATIGFLIPYSTTDGGFATVLYVLVVDTRGRYIQYMYDTVAQFPVGGTNKRTLRVRYNIMMY